MQARLTQKKMMPRMIELGDDFTDDEQQAIDARKAYWAGVFAPVLLTETIYTPTMSEENGKSVGTDIIRETVCISADPDVHVNFASRYLRSRIRSPDLSFRRS
jgi:hypothetical protein